MWVAPLSKAFSVDDAECQRRCADQKQIEEYVLGLQKGYSVRGPVQQDTQGIVVESKFVALGKGDLKVPEGMPADVKEGRSAE